MFVTTMDTVIGSPSPAVKGVVVRFDTWNSAGFGTGVGVGVWLGAGVLVPGTPVSDGFPVGLPVGLGFGDSGEEFDAALTYVYARASTEAPIIKMRIRIAFDLLIRDFGVFIPSLLGIISLILID
jgi:hypothetical protein